MVLTREEKEKLVLDLYNQGKSTREIAEEARMSFRDIGVILNTAIEEKETSKEQAEKMSQSTQAYKLFSEGKSPVQVAIALNIREPEVARFYVEYWKLVQHHSLSRIYEEIKDDIGYFVRLYRLAKVARMSVPQVVKVLEIANNDLPVVEHRYDRRKREVDDLEAEKRNSARIFQELTDKISTMLKGLDSIRLDCEKELAQRSVVSEKYETRGCCKSLSKQ
jgi:DNA-binding CsgD family transcriptional regulator